MIVWIIDGKSPTVDAAVKYVCDKMKTVKNFDEIRSFYENSPNLKEDIPLEDFYLLCQDNVNRALNYIANEDKIGGYITGYLCDPELAEEQFKQTKQTNLARVGKTIEDDTGNYFYHIIQSFPEDIDISDDEVHQCGVELVERLGLYQAVITSHIHPVKDEEGEVHGRCKHNHIIMNSHIYHEFVDTTNPRKMKYNNCKESYAQLQLINDQIAIEHGLPIIINQDNERAYSWYENEEANRGKSWKQRVKTDINNAMKVSYDFHSFTEAMNAAGYHFRLGKSKTHGEYITYTCPDDTHKVRDYILGTGYTKAEMESYWDIKKSINEELLNNQDGTENRIVALLKTTKEPIYIKFEKTVSTKRKEKMREYNLNIKNTYTNYFSLNIPNTTKARAEFSYFKSGVYYDICNAQHQSIGQVSGDEILEYFNRKYELENEEERRRKETEYYSRHDFINSAVNSPYKVRLWDKSGRKRSMIELIIILAVVTINNEDGKWESKEASSSQQQETQRHPIYARRDWKVQNMIDTIKVAREENINDLEQLEARLNIAGKDVSKARAEQRRMTAAINKMEVLYEAIEGYKEVKDICEKIHNMPDGSQKTELQQQYAEEIEEYKKNKSVMYRFKVTSDSEIQEFQGRYEEMKQKLSFVETEVDRCKEEYRKLSKLKYNIQLAQSKQYCYGPEYRAPELTPSQQQDQMHTEERTKQ